MPAMPVVATPQPATKRKTAIVYCHGDNTCSVKVDGEEYMQKFYDLPEVVNYMHGLPEFKGGEFTVLDPAGKVLFRAFL